MFKTKANNLCNNALFKCAMIPVMNDQMTRLYKAAFTLKNVTGQSAVAALMNESPQTLNNWESRGMSKKGMFQAEEMIGCRARWIKDGSGAMTGEQQQVDQSVKPDQLIILINVFSSLGVEDRKILLEFASSLQGTTVSDRSVANDQF